MKRTAPSALPTDCASDSLDGPRVNTEDTSALASHQSNNIANAPPSSRPTDAAATGEPNSSSNGQTHDDDSTADPRVKRSRRVSDGQPPSSSGSADSGEACDVSAAASITAVTATAAGSRDFTPAHAPAPAPAPAPVPAPAPAPVQHLHARAQAQAQWQWPRVSEFRYEAESPIGRGAYGHVSSAISTHCTTHVVRSVAIKRLDIAMDYCTQNDALREISVLRTLDHPNIVKYLDTFWSQPRTDVECQAARSAGAKSLNIVLELANHTMTDAIKKYPFTEADCKLFLHDMLSGLACLHANGLLHRDLKPSNCLLFLDSFTLKLADFGMSRPVEQSARPITARRCTALYRAPEVMLGSEQYSYPSDVWGAGAVFAEFISREIIFAAQTEMEVVKKIFSIVGAPTEANWPGFSALPLASIYIKIVEHGPGKPLGHFVPSLPSEGVDLLVQMLTLDPLRRITADEALKHPYFGGFDADAYRAGRARDLAERRMRSMDCDGLAGAYGGVE